MSSFKDCRPTVSRSPSLCAWYLGSHAWPSSRGARFCPTGGFLNRDRAEGEGVEPSRHCCSAVFGTAAIALWLALPNRESSFVIGHSQMTNDQSMGSLGFEPRPSQIKSLERCLLRHDPGYSGNRGDVYGAWPTPPVGRISIRPPPLSSRGRIKIRPTVGREALESSSAVLQTAAKPSQLPTQQKRPGVLR